MVYEFFRWWFAQLADCIPERWRSRAGDIDAIVIAPATTLSEPVENIVVADRRNGRETAIGRFPVGGSGLMELRQAGRPAVLRLAQGDVLSKTLTLPSASERHLDQALAFEMDRETPFSPEELFWSYRVVQRDRRAGQIRVRLQILQRAKLTRLLDALDRAGLKPHRAEFTETYGAKGYLRLDAEDIRASRAGRPSLLWAGVACCVVLALAAAAIPFVRQQLRLAALDRQIAADRVAVAEAQDLRRQIDQFAAGADVVENERAKGGRPLAILAALTRKLPEDTYLTELLEQQRKVTISGRSAAASRLIALLAAGDGLRNPTFAAPVTRIEATHIEVFSITAEIAP